MNKNNLFRIFYCTLALLILISACTPAPAPATVPSTASAPEAEDNVLNIYNWDTYIDESILTDFEEKYGITINYSTYTSNEELISALLAGPVDYDLVVPTDYAVELLRKEAIFGAINKTNIPNFNNIASTFINPSYDPGNRYCIPYQWGTIGIGYNIQSTGKEISSWADIFDPIYAGRISMLDEARISLGITLLHLGYSPNTTNQIEIDEAAKFLKSNAAQISVYAPDTGQDLLAAGDVDITMEYSGDIFQVMSENTDILYVVPEDGAIIWSDSLCLLANAPNKENAELFLNYILDPEVGATLSNYIKYASPNQAALPFIDEADRNNPGMYPSEDVRARLFFLSDVGSATQFYNDAWSDVLANHGK